MQGYTIIETQVNRSPSRPGGAVVSDKLTPEQRNLLRDGYVNLQHIQNALDDLETVEEMLREWVKDGDAWRRQDEKNRDAIERLTAEVERLREALEALLFLCEHGDFSSLPVPHIQEFVKVKNKARALVAAVKEE